MWEEENSLNSFEAVHIDMKISDIGQLPIFELNFKDFRDCS